MRTIFLLLVITLPFWSCQRSQGGVAEKSVEEIMDAPAIRNSDIVRNPVTINKPADTVNVAKMEFEEARYDFGEVNEGEVVEHTFAFTNTGKVPLVIGNARSTCGCTVPEWPRKPIAPGEKGTIKVRFNTENKSNLQSKPITISANTWPSETKVFLTGQVNPKPDLQVN